MCSRDVEKLHVSMYGNRVSGPGNGDAAAVALCECLRAWSSTLQCLKISIRGNHDLYPLMSEAIASLSSFVSYNSTGRSWIFALFRISHDSSVSESPAVGMSACKRHMKRCRTFLDISLFRGCFPPSVLLHSSLEDGKYPTSFGISVVGGTFSCTNAGRRDPGYPRTLFFFSDGAPPFNIIICIFKSCNLHISVSVFCITFSFSVQPTSLSDCKTRISHICKLALTVEKNNLVNMYVRSSLGPH